MEPVGVRHQNNLIDAGSDIGMVLQSADSRVVACNPVAEHLLGYTAAQLIGTTWLDSRWQQTSPDGEHPARVALRTGKPCLNVTVGFYQPNGELIWLQVSSHPLFQADGTTPYGVMTMLCAIADRLTCHKTTEQQLAEIEAIYATAPIGLCFIDTDLRFVRINEHLAQMNGFPVADHIGRTLREILPEQADDLEPIYRQVIESGETLENLEFSGTNSAQPGIQRCWLLSLYPFCDDNGAVVGVNVMVQEITERKQTEAVLRQQAQIINQIHDSVISTDLNGYVTNWNQGAERLFGYSASEALGQHISLLYPTPQMQDVLQDQVIEPLLRQGEHEVEVQMQRKSGETMDALLLLSLLRDEKQIPIGMIGYSMDITSRKQVEAALRQMNERFRLATLAIDGIVFEWNMQTGEVYRSEGLYQLIGVRVEDAAPTREWWLERIHPDDFARMESGMQSLESLGDRYEGEYRIRHADGRWIDVWERGCLRRDRSGQIVGILGFTTDITNRKQAEITLRQSEQRYRYLTESIPQLVWTANAWGALLDLNQRWLDFTGLTLAQAQTQGWEAIAHPEDLPILSANWAAAQTDGTCYQAEGRIRRADGVYRWHLHQAIALKDERNQIVKWFGTATDIEDQKQLEQQRDRLLQQEQIAREKAEQANRIKDEFLAVLSHELRTPLNPILGWTKLLQTGKVNATKTAEALSTIERNAKLQAQLIEDLLDVSRILRGKLTLDVAPVNLADAIAAALETVKLAAQAKNIQIQTELNPNPVMVAGDGARLQQIVWNLLSNAVKFTPQGGQVKVKLQILDGRLQIERKTQIKSNQSEIPNLKSEIPYAQIQVIDNGKGIKPEFLPYVFEHFRQEDSAITRKFGGLGLGLAIVRQLVELHGGTVFAESQGEGNGATFTVRLPLLKQQPENENNMDLDEYMIQSSPLAGLKIIVVDDDADSREFITFLLEQDGAEVIALPSALQALREFPHSKPDILVSDVGMPEMDGYMLMQQIRALPPDQGGKVPAIALTAYAGEVDKNQAIAAGFQQHIPKPIEPDQLVQAVAKLAGKP